MEPEMHTYKVFFTFYLSRTFNIDIKTVQVVVDADSKKEAKIIATGLLSEEFYTKGLLDARTYKEKAETFTKEQVIELTEKAWNDSARVEFNRIVAQLSGDDEKAATVINYKQWLEQENLLTQNKAI